MASVFRWLLRIVSGLLFLTLATILVVYYLGSRSLVDYDANYRLQGIDNKIEIVRDTSSVPHVFGATDKDVFFGLGFAHAQDRLWQMTMLRRTAQGRLSELFGPRTVNIDSLMRRLDIYPLSVKSVDAQDPETLAALDAYSAGVNAWLNTVNQEALGRGAPELFLFSNEIAPWQPADSIAVMKLMSLQLSGHLEEEIIRARASLALQDDRVNDILPDAPGVGTAELPDFASLFPKAPRYAKSTTEHDPLSPAKPRGLAGASNAWAAAPKRSAAGGALLANDPHLGFSAPAIWYLARIELSSGGVIGGTIPGIPTVLVGRSDKLGWGLTSS
ncbi:MAG: penicillin acylase family protein, partial [Hyphomicrobiales bacterium]